MRVYARLDNFTTRPRFQSRILCIFPRTKSQSSKNEKNINVPEDENNLVQTRLGGEFWASDVIMHKAHSSAPLFPVYFIKPSPHFNLVNINECCNDLFIIYTGVLQGN